MSVWEDSSYAAGLVLTLADLGAGEQQDHSDNLGVVNDLGMLTGSELALVKRTH